MNIEDTEAVRVLLNFLQRFLQLILCRDIEVTPKSWTLFGPR